MGVDVLTEEMKSTAVDTGEEFGINAGHYGYISIFNEYKRWNTGHQEKFKAIYFKCSEGFYFILPAFMGTWLGN